MAEEREDSSLVRWRERRGCGWDRACAGRRRGGGGGGVVVPEGVGEALEDFDAVGELEVFCVGSIWGGAAGVNVFEEEGEVAEAPEEVLGVLGERRGVAEVEEPSAEGAGVGGGCGGGGAEIEG
jgi:hypothetical protein